MRCLPRPRSRGSDSTCRWAYQTSTRSAYSRASTRAPISRLATEYVLPWMWIVLPVSTRACTRLHDSSRRPGNPRSSGSSSASRSRRPALSWANRRPKNSSYSIRVGKSRPPRSIRAWSNARLNR